MSLENTPRTSSTARHEMRRRAGRDPSVGGGRKRPRRRRGTALVLIAVLMMIFLATAAISIDVAYMQLVRSELQASTDTAAKAAVVILGETGDINAARVKAMQIARLNTVAGRELLLDPQDIVFGSGQFGANGSIEFIPNATPYRAAQVTGRKLGASSSGSVPLFFGGVIGTPEFEAELQATAAFLDRDMVLVVDKSDSMAGGAFVDLKDAVLVFLQTLQDNQTQERVGLASYAESAYFEYFLTTDLIVVGDVMNAMMTARARTNIGGGIDMGRQVLLSDPGSSLTEKVIILLTDGHHNTGTDPRIAAVRAINDGIVIHTVTFGWYADQVLMRDVANMTGGEFRHAPDGATLSDVFRELALIRKVVLTK